MVLFGRILMTTMVIMAECQVIWPNDTDVSSSNKFSKVCTASNGQTGTCYEYRSAEFKECSSFFPSIDQSIPDVKSHLEANICPQNLATEIYFCCPTITTQLVPAEPVIPINQRPDIIPSEDECGLSLRDNVVGGNITDKGDWPWLAALGRKIGAGFIPFCGGSLITKQHVISAAHCFNMRYSNTIVRLGEYDVNTVNAVDGAQDFNIVDERVANYNTETKENDIILLKLDRPIDAFTDSIRAACLPYHLRSETFEEKHLVVVGWGVFLFDENGARTSAVPYQGVVPLVPISECQERYRKISSSNTIDDRQLCAGRGGTDSCNGDSGGPLNYLDINKGRFYVVGLVSWGPRNCGDNNLPGVYARIGNYLDWIEENIKQLL